jgi:hypothetical protein
MLEVAVSASGPVYEGKSQKRKGKVNVKSFVLPLVSGSYFDLPLLSFDLSPLSTAPTPLETS